MEEYIFYKDEKFIRGDICGLGRPEYYPNTLPEDWYWAENSKKEENRFLPHSSFRTDSKMWDRTKIIR